MKPRIIVPDNGLARMVDLAAGADGRSLIEAADKRIEAIRPDLRRYVEARVTHLLGFVLAPDEALFAHSRVLGETALEIAETAGPAGMASVGEIARGISAMIEKLSLDGAWHSDGVRVHLHALSRAAAQGAENDFDSDALVLDQLRTMRGVLGVSE